MVSGKSLNADDVLIFYLSVGGAVKLYFEEDLFPGEVFGETALSGMHTRLITAQAITNVDLAVIDDSDFVLAQDRDSMHMGTEERVIFLKQIPMFKQWDNYKLMRLAVALVQEEVNKNVIMIQKGNVCKDLYLLVNGRIDIIDHIEKKNVVTSLLKYDYLGESGLINKFVKASSSKVVEDHCAMAITRVDVLILHESNYFIFDLPNIEVIRNAFSAKSSWRKDRLIKMKSERAKVRSYKKIMSKEFDNISLLESGKQNLGFRDVLTSANVTFHNRSVKLPILDCEFDHNAFEESKSNTSLFAQKSKVIRESKSCVVNKDSKLNDLEDIPQIFIEGFDPFMITTSIKNKAILEKVQDAMILGRRPKSARLLIASADSRRHFGFSGEKPRPFSASATHRKDPDIQCVDNSHKTTASATTKGGFDFVDLTSEETFEIANFQKLTSNPMSRSPIYLRGSCRIPSPISYSTG